VEANLLGVNIYGLQYTRIFYRNFKKIIKKILNMYKNILIKNSLIYFFANAVNAMVPMALLPILTRYLSPIEYGIIAMFQTALGLISAFIGLSASGVAIRKYYDKHSGEDYAEFIGSCVHVILLSSIFSSIIIWILEEHFRLYFGLENYHIYSALLLSTMNAIIQLRLVQWQVRNSALNYFSFLFWQGAANFTSSVIFIMIMSLSADGRIYGQLITGLAFGGISLILLKNNGLLKMSVFNIGYIKEIVRFGFPLVPHMSSAFLLGAIDRLIVNRELGSYQVGIYMVAVQFAAVFGLIFDSVNKAFVPWLFGKLKKNQMNELIKIVRWTYLSFFILSLFAIILFSVSPAVVLYIAGNNYSEASEIVGFLIVGQIFSGMYYLVTNYIFYSKKTIVLSVLSVSSGLLNLVLLLILVPGYGIKGAALSFAMSAFAQFVLTWFAAYKLHPMPWFSKDVFQISRN
jgi:O-antigen/teichoic acid export membrane protein